MVISPMLLSMKNRWLKLSLKTKLTQTPGRRSRATFGRLTVKGPIFLLSLWYDQDMMLESFSQLPGVGIAAPRSFSIGGTGEPRGL